MSAYRSRLVATAEEDSLNLHTRVERPGRKATLIGYADPRRGACSTRLAISSQICAMASRSARSFSAETVSRVSRHFFARCRYSSGPFFGCVGGFKSLIFACDGNAIWPRRQCDIARSVRQCDIARSVPPRVGSTTQQAEPPLGETGRCYPCCASIGQWEKTGPAADRAASQQGIRHTLNGQQEEYVLTAIGKKVLANT